MTAERFLVLSDALSKKVLLKHASCFQKQAQGHDRGKFSSNFNGMIAEKFVIISEALSRVKINLKDMPADGSAIFAMASPLIFRS